jgi:nicotinamide mononucleotide adenylyltransferase
LAANFVNTCCSLFIYAVCIIFANQINKKYGQEPLFKMSFLSANTDEVYRESMVSRNDLAATKSREQILNDENVQNYLRQTYRQNDMA